MHELSIALSIVETASDEASRRNVSRVTAIHLRVGALAGVVKEALTFSFAVASRDTLLDGCRLIIEEVPVEIFCSTCNVVRRVESIQQIRCSECDDSLIRMIRGRELEFVSMEIEQDELIEEEYFEAASG